MKEIVDKVSILFETSPNSFTIKKHYNYYATERYGVLNSYHIMLKYNDGINILITLMVGNEIYTDEVLWSMWKGDERFDGENLSIEELVEKIKNRDFKKE
jgi:hypothetical protein